MSEYFEGMTDPRQEGKEKHSFIMIHIPAS